MTMRKMLALLTALMATLTVAAQETKPIIIPGKGKINVENLRKVDLNMDISQLNICELRALRNSFAAKQGYLFNSSELRQLFNTTSWYDELAWKRALEEEKMAPVKYTAKETAFINKLKAREDELRKRNFTSSTGIVNLDNLVNPFQLEVFPTEMKTHLSKYGFGIVEADNEQIFQVYEKNDYCMFPNFVTTDLYLQLFHLYFDTMMRKVEEGKLSDVMQNMCQKLHKHMNTLASSASNATMRECAQWNTAYFAVAHQLISGKALSVPANYAEMAKDEVEKSINAKDAYSQFLGYQDVKFAYGLFKPRGHYTRSEQCKKYFRAMMWLQTVPFGTDDRFKLRCAALIADALRSNADLKKAYDSVFEPITYLMGAPDNITIIQVGDVLKEQGVTVAQLMKDGKLMDNFRNRIDVIAEKQTRIRPKFERTSHNKINFMPQRYQPDAEVLLEMADYDNMETKRDVPMGLDVMAAMGSYAAERILINELKQDKQWEGFIPNLNKVKAVMNATDWNVCIANQWLSTLNTLNTFDDARLPYFMKVPQWNKKNLNATLASWAELKHDAILYAKQPMAAECGDGSLPAPTVTGFVEPNTGFWRKAIQLIDNTRGVFSKYNLLTDDITSITEDIKDEAEFFLNASLKELDGKRLTNEEYDHIRYIGATFENLSLELIKEPNQSLMGWYDVQGADKSIAVVADVYTANGDNNPEPSILFEAVGPADEMYVVVEVDGYLYLMRGGVFSYREFKQPVDQPRLTDEEWQEKLKTYPNTGKPSWMKEIIIPINTKPVPNETVFYGTGC